MQGEAVHEHREKEIVDELFRQRQNLRSLIRLVTFLPNNPEQQLRRIEQVAEQDKRCCR